MRFAPRVVALVVLAAGFAGGAWIYRAYGTIEVFAAPPRIHFCGRDFHGGVTTVTGAQLPISGGRHVYILEPTLGLLPIGAPEPAPVTLACSTSIYLHVGPDSYAGYDLVGGP